MITKGSFEGDLGRRVTPTRDHLHQLDFQIAIIGQSLRVLTNRKSSTKFTTIYNRHPTLLLILKSPTSGPLRGCFVKTLTPSTLSVQFGLASLQISPHGHQSCPCL